MEITGHAPHEDACPRCGRTFFLSRFLRDPAVAQRQERAAAAVAVAKKSFTRRAMAKNIREMRATGCWGYQVIPAEDRAAVARAAIDRIA